MQAAVFAKPLCPRVTVAVIGHKIELQRYVRMLYADDVAFLQDGRLGDTVTAAGNQSARLRRLRAMLMGDSADTALPILAITPAPTGDVCSAPGEDAWSQPPRPHER